MTRIDLNPTIEERRESLAALLRIAAACEGQSQEAVKAEIVQITGRLLDARPDLTAAFVMTAGVALYYAMMVGRVIAAESVGLVDDGEDIDPAEMSIMGISRMLEAHMEAEFDKWELAE